MKIFRLLIFIVCLNAFANDELTVEYECDGRLYCNQMSSCEEATWFLENCPDVKMDGDYDGIPCEREHCQHKRYRG